MWTELVCVLLRLFLLAAVPPAGGRGRSVQVLKVLGLRDSSRAGRYHPISHPGRGSGWLSDQPPGAGAAPPPTRALVPVEVFSLLFSLFFSSGFSLVKSRAASSLTAHSVICAMVIALRTSVSPLEIRTIVPASQVAIWITFNRLRQRDGIVWQKLTK